MSAAHPTSSSSSIKQIKSSHPNDTVGQYQLLQSELLESKAQPYIPGFVPRTLCNPGVTFDGPLARSSWQTIARNDGLREIAAGTTASNSSTRRALPIALTPAALHPLNVKHIPFLSQITTIDSPDLELLVSRLEKPPLHSDYSAKSKDAFAGQLPPSIFESLLPCDHCLAHVTRCFHVSLGPPSKNPDGFPLRCLRCYCDEIDCRFSFDEFNSKRIKACFLPSWRGPRRKGSGVQGAASFNHELVSVIEESLKRGGTIANSTRSSAEPGSGEREQQRPRMQDADDILSGEKLASIRIEVPMPEATASANVHDLPDRGYSIVADRAIVTVLRDTGTLSIELRGRHMPTHRARALLGSALKARPARSSKHFDIHSWTRLPGVVIPPAAAEVDEGSIESSEPSGWDDLDPVVYDLAILTSIRSLDDPSFAAVWKASAQTISERLLGDPGISKGVARSVPEVPFMYLQTDLTLADRPCWREGLYDRDILDILLKQISRAVVQNPKVSLFVVPFVLDGNQDLSAFRFHDLALGIVSAEGTTVAFSMHSRIDLVIIYDDLEGSSARLAKYRELLEPFYRQSADKDAVWTIRRNMPADTDASSSTTIAVALLDLIVKDPVGLRQGIDTLAIESTQFDKNGLKKLRAHHQTAVMGGLSRQDVAYLVGEARRVLPQLGYPPPASGD